MIKWHSEKRKISELKPFPGNPRKADEKQWKDLEKSLDKFNLADPLIINTDNTVIGGNFRLKVLKEKGIKEVDNLGIWDYTEDNEKKRNKIQKMENMSHLWEKIFC